VNQFDPDEEGFPCMLDLEASSFGPNSYPIEAAWSDDDGEIHRCLISPEVVPSWTDWSDESEAVHGIDRGRLLRNGWDPDYVAARIEENLGGKIVYSDAPDFDGRWLQPLFAVVDRPVPFALEHIDELLIPMLRKPGELVYQAIQRIEELKAELQPKMAGRHAAGYDVGYLLALWRRARGETVKMNHGVGPLPQSSPTGTFLPIRLRGSANE
jgi:hypothetical protein